MLLTERIPTSDPVPASEESVTSGKVDVTVVLPCYNEQDHVLLEIARINEALQASEFSYELLVIDDASTDNTLEVLQKAQADYPHMRLEPFQRNGGTGTVRRIGTQIAYGEIVVWTDADMSYPNERIPEMVRILKENPRVDQVVGARTTEEGTHKILRVPAKWIIRKIAERLINQKIPDLNSGMRAMRKEVAKPYLRLLPPGFSCVTTITMAFLANQHDIYYMPIDYSKRAGKSKFKFVKDAYRYILQVLRMVMYFNPIKVLLPPSLVLIGVGVVKAVYDLVSHPFKIADDTVLLFLAGLIIASLALLADLIVRSRDDG
jgi:glycosyltransferase involved in cell wall biosynthesis